MSFLSNDIYDSIMHDLQNSGAEVLESKTVKRPASETLAVVPKKRGRPKKDYVEENEKFLAEKDRLDDEEKKRGSNRVSSIKSRSNKKDREVAMIVGEARERRKNEQLTAMAQRMHEHCFELDEMIRHES
jgi:microcompartment protein CcmL/EutN